MTDKAHLVRFKHANLGTQSVIAASAQIHDEHVVLLNPTGKLAVGFES